MLIYATVFFCVHPIHTLNKISGDILRLSCLYAWKPVVCELHLVYQTSQSNLPGLYWKPTLNSRFFQKRKNRTDSTGVYCHKASGIYLSGGFQVSSCGSPIIHPLHLPNEASSPNGHNFMALDMLVAVLGFLMKCFPHVLLKWKLSHRGGNCPSEIQNSNEALSWSQF